MNVRYKPAWGIGLTSLGVIALGMGVVLTAIGGRPHIGNWISGGVALVVGIGYLRRDYFRLVSGELQIPAAIGPLVKRYPIENPGDLVVTDGRLYHRGKKLGLTPTMARKEDWAAFLASRTTPEVFD
jgi:hypothetical protein